MPDAITGEMRVTLAATKMEGSVQLQKQGSR